MQNAMCQCSAQKVHSNFIEMLMCMVRWVEQFVIPVLSILQDRSPLRLLGIGVAVLHSACRTAQLSYLFLTCMFASAPQAQSDLLVLSFRFLPDDLGTTCCPACEKVLLGAAQGGAKIAKMFPDRRFA